MSILAAVGVTKRFGPNEVLKNVSPVDWPREIRADLRRERRRQEHAGQDLHRRPSGRWRRRAGRRSPGRDPRPAARPGARHRAGGAGVEPRLRPCRCWTTSGSATAPCRCSTGAGSCASGRERRSTQSGSADLPLETPVSRAEHRPAAAGRDRPHAHARRPRADPRRTDRDALRRRDRAHLQRAARAQGRGQVDHLHHPSARRGVRDLRHRSRCCATANWSAPAAPPRSTASS